MVKRYTAKIELKGMPLYIVDKMIESGMYAGTREEVVQQIFLGGIRRLDTTDRSKTMSVAEVEKARSTIDSIVVELIKSAGPKLGLSEKEARKRGYIP